MSLQDSFGNLINLQHIDDSRKGASFTSFFIPYFINCRAKHFDVTRRMKPRGSPLKLSIGLDFLTVHVQRKEYCVNVDQILKPICQLFQECDSFGSK